jgi:hypothetical protein
MVLMPFLNVVVVVDDKKIIVMLRDGFISGPVSFCAFSDGF